MAPLFHSWLHLIKEPHKAEKAEKTTVKREVKLDFLIKEFLFSGNSHVSGGKNMRTFPQLSVKMNTGTTLLLVAGKLQGEKLHLPAVYEDYYGRGSVGDTVLI